MPRFLTYARRTGRVLRRNRQRTRQHPGHPGVRLALVRLSLAALVTIGGAVWALARLMWGDTSGALIVASCAAMAACAIGGSLLSPPR